MTKLEWGGIEDRVHEIGVEQGVLFPPEGPGVAWNGLTKIVETKDGGEAMPFYLDGYKYSNESSYEELELELEAFSYPEEFNLCVGQSEILDGIFIGQQEHVPFSFAYKSLVERTGGEQSSGYKIHLVFDAVALSPEITRSSLSERPDGLLYSWPIVLVDALVPGYKPTMHISIDSTIAKPANFEAFEEIIFGGPETYPSLMTPDQVLEFFKYDLRSLRIEPNEVSGISLLRETAPSDLKGFLEKGVYWRTDATRLRETNMPGIFELE